MNNKYNIFVQQFNKGCIKCCLHKHDNHPVIYRGNPNASIMLVGESPGLYENKLGKPFVGPAGHLLDKIFGAITIDTNTDMILTNATFCRPVAPKDSNRQNYTPKEEQIKICRQHLIEQIELINPKIIIACGRVALSSLTENYNIKISKYEGTWIQYKQIPMFIMTHPASILHLSKWPEKQLEKKKQVWNYMQFFKDTYKTQK